MNITAMNSYSHLPITTTISAAAMETSSKTKHSADDTVSISPEASKLSFLASFMDGAGEDGVITLEEIEAFRDKQLEKTQNFLQDTLKNLGIDPSDRLEIDIDPFNEVVVTGGTDAENKSLATALQENSEFKNAYKGASASSTFLAAAEAATRFQDAYGSDPNATVAKYGWLFDKDWDFTLSYENGKMDYSIS